MGKGRGMGGWGDGGGVINAIVWEVIVLRVLSDRAVHCYGIRGKRTGRRNSVRCCVNYGLWVYLLMQFDAMWPMSRQQYLLW